MTKTDIHAVLVELKSESSNINTNDTDAIEHLNQLIEKLEQLLSEPEIVDDPSMFDQMQLTVNKFEASHPKLTATVNDLMVKLAGLGV